TATASNHSCVIWRGSGHADSQDQSSVPTARSPSASSGHGYARGDDQQGRIHRRFEDRQRTSHARRVSSGRCEAVEVQTVSAERPACRSSDRGCGYLQFGRGLKTPIRVIKMLQEQVEKASTNKLDVFASSSV